MHPGRTALAAALIGLAACRATHHDGSSADPDDLDVDAAPPATTAIDLPDEPPPPGLDAVAPGAAADARTVADASAPVEVGPARPRMSFFVTSVGSDAGGNFGGLEGADRRCQALAAAVGAGARTWRAYLGTAQHNEPMVNARDRIGKGPWFNQHGDLIANDVASLHASGIAPALIRDEKGAHVPSGERAIVTGSKRDGTPYVLRVCRNWTVATDGVSDGDFARLGHADGPATAWNDAQGSTCSPARLKSSGSSGRFYCFAADPAP